MAQEAVVIPEKIYFKIGEVCELVGVQAHVLRYWETEFSTLSPQKNKSGQRSYRRRDVEIALRIKQLLYNEMFTIAGARKKLQIEAREGSKPKEEALAAPAVKANVAFGRTGAPLLFDAGFNSDLDSAPVETASPETNLPPPTFNDVQRDAIKILAGHLLDLREMLKHSRIS